MKVPVLVIGGGVAGLSTAIEVGKSGTHVLVLTKAWLSDTNTELAQGGVAAVLSPEDSVESHAGDTQEVGCGLCHPDVVADVVGGGAAAIQRLLDWGGQFDRSQTGSLSLTLEGGHSAGRVVHAMGDQTGREIQRVLAQRARELSTVSIVEHAFVLDLLVDEGVVVGATAFVGGRVLCISAGTVIVATGGCGQIYRETTNPEVATGDGHAMLFRAGARLRGMEFVQFHPTTLYIAGSSRVLISEAARGEGAILRDCNGVAFMDELHPKGCLAPRDFVSRAVLDRMVSTGKNVYLDLTHLPPTFVRSRFPRIYRVCMSFDLDITREPIPVAPAAHYMIGGAVVDRYGRTSLPGLMAVGEVACSGLHGANRLASNSLLEGLVLGSKAARVALEEARPARDPARLPRPRTCGAGRGGDDTLDSADLLNSVRALMWRHVGLLRNGVELAEADYRLESWLRSASGLARPTPRDWELLNLMQVARLIARAARERSESRGVHYRSDFPDPDDRRWLADLELVGTADGDIDVRRAPVPAAEKSARAPSAGSGSRGRT